jgi:hypothetical protein
LVDIWQNAVRPPPRLLDACAAVGVTCPE